MGRFIPINVSWEEEWVILKFLTAEEVKEFIPGDNYFSLLHQWETQKLPKFKGCREHSYLLPPREAMRQGLCFHTDPKKFERYFDLNSLEFLDLIPCVTLSRWDNPRDTCQLYKLRKGTSLFRGSESGKFPRDPSSARGFASFFGFYPKIAEMILYEKAIVQKTSQGLEFKNGYVSHFTVKEDMYLIYNPNMGLKERHPFGGDAKDWCESKERKEVRLKGKQITVDGFFNERNSLIPQIYPLPYTLRGEPQELLKLSFEDFVLDYLDFSAGKPRVTKFAKSEKPYEQFDQIPGFELVMCNTSQHLQLEGTYVVDTEQQLRSMYSEWRKTLGEIQEYEKEVGFNPQQVYEAYHKRTGKASEKLEKRYNEIILGKFNGRMKEKQILLGTGPKLSKL